VPKPRFRTVEMIIAASVVVISVASLFVAVYQGIVMERTMKASVWPLVQYDTSNYDTGREVSQLSFTLSNQGIGPAHIETFELFYQGETITDTEGLLALCCSGQETVEEGRQYLRSLELPIITSTVTDKILSTGENINFLIVRQTEDELEQAVWDALNRERRDISLRVCYCSVFEDCWIFEHGRHQETIVQRHSVDRCERPSAN